MAKSEGMVLKRGFVDVGHGQIHYRWAGPSTTSGKLAVLLHPSPGSSLQLGGLLRALGKQRRVFAPDTCGNGDSSPLPEGTVTIAALAEAAWQGINQFAGDATLDLYGSHTGASLAMEIAIAHPDRVGRLVLDGMGLYDPAGQTELLSTYARRFHPDIEAAYLMQVWHFCRDQYLFWPYFNRTADHRLPGGLPPAEEFHAFFLEVLKGMGSYHGPYQAVFSHPKRERLPLIRVPTLVLTDADDVLHPYAREICRLVAGSRMETIAPGAFTDMPAARAEAIGRFFDG